MKALRNTSSQALLVYRPKDSVVHLMPGRAVTLGEAELRSSQVRELVARDFARIIELGATAAAPVRETPEYSASSVPEPERTRKAPSKSEPGGAR